MPSSPSDRVDDVATASFVSFGDEDGSYERVSRAGEDGCSVLRRQTTFDAAQAMDEDEE